MSVFDIGFKYGATFYESLRTFKHKIFKLDEHLARLERSLRYVGLVSLINKTEMAEIIEKVLATNIHLTEKDDDVFISVEVTPGVGFPHPLMKQKEQKPTVIVYTSPLPYEEYAHYYIIGKPAVIVNVRNVPPQTFDSRSKNRSRLYFFIAKREAMKIDPDAFALLLDLDGNITEGTGANFFIVADNTLYTPTTRNILNGITRQTVIELARKMNLPVVEADINLYDVYNADEAFFTTTTYCILPISRVNGVTMNKEIPGLCTRRLLTAWSEMVGVDIVKQAQTFMEKRKLIW
ncbi:hypothetical protein AUJ66_02330 [Candidatus Desantisbacteria bacterium CG1_02_38_46]|uniref:Branched-chain amino acid aminotransferase n=2 Tax=unclassified Candidatus Desantisiibacteriota TaxID=3106372 RepID=A0A1J4SGJ9_9BACT|nr:MAG: hypothetical protein AUJ66_02330 [Candidatus Desantisbacteria bacterium CG1_02_38_46]PIU52007.1 MAG: branched-chain amino acid aminotransferase [Candidatus Desantisbacteria bacterium CG07_land_8_20_14_0_80_39_15]